MSSATVMKSAAYTSPRGSGFAASGVRPRVLAPQFLNEPDVSLGRRLVSYHPHESKVRCSKYSWLGKRHAILTAISEPRAAGGCRRRWRRRGSRCLLGSASACANGPRIWSPEQICGRLKACGLPAASHEAIYQRLYADKRNGGTLHRALRCQKALRKRYRGRERRGTIPNQVSIEQRPAIANSRRRFDDWEGDLVIGAGQHQALVTLNERKSRYWLIAHVPFKTAQAVSDTMISVLTPFAGYVHTLTTDNGKEFAQHERIAGKLDAPFFFAHPYASWERGANENMNGLIPLHDRRLGEINTTLSVPPCNFVGTLS